MSTPAIVACTPLSSIANHAATPSTRYGPRWRTFWRARRYISASHGERPGEPRELHVVGVEDGDHGDRADVVDHRHAEQEDHRATAARAGRAAPRRRARRRCPSPSGCPSRPRRRRRRRPATNSSAGTTMPPIAATSGRRAARRSANSPVTSSRLTSSPMTRKNIAISPSLTACAHRLDVRPVADGEGDLGAPDVLVRSRRDVGPDQGGDRRGEQHDGARDLRVEEVGQRADDEARHRPVGPSSLPNLSGGPRPRSTDRRTAATNRAYSSIAVTGACALAAPTASSAPTMSNTKVSSDVTRRIRS